MGRISGIQCLLCTLIFFIGCESKKIFPGLSVTPIELETASSGMSRLSINSEGKAFISWIEYLNDDLFQLQFAQLQNEDWTSPKIIATSGNWFVNWADFPSLSSFGNGQLVSHWLEMRGEGTYEYDVKISILSGDIEWSLPFTPHQDEVAAEHGFVSMLSIGKDKMMLSWLDGRNTALESSNYGDEHHAHHGAMSLRTAIVDTSGHLSNQLELDNRVCDCCQTDMAMTEAGPVIVYRDRSQNEIRDISIVRIVDGVPSEPKSVYNDEWMINGCPVNGPAVDAVDSLVAVAWFTSADGTSKVQVTISRDNGKNFDLPIQIDQGSPLGRVDCTWVSDELNMVTWLEAFDKETWICARFVQADGTSSKLHRLIKTQSNRRSGFPTITRDNDGVLLSWTEIGGDSSKVRTARISFDIL